MLAVDGKQSLKGEVVFVVFRIGVSDPVVVQIARQVVVDRFVPGQAEATGPFLPAEDGAAALAKAEPGEALKTVAFFCQVPVVGEAAVEAAVGFGPAFVQRDAGSELAVEKVEEGVAVTSVKIGAGRKGAVAADIGGGIKALLVLQANAEVIGRPHRAGLSVVIQIDASAEAVANIVGGARFEQKTAAFPKGTSYGSIPVFAFGVVIAQVSDEEAVPAVAAYRRGEP